jgi:ribosome recycling factor
MNEYFDAMTEEMDKPVKHLRVEFAKVRTGRASLAVLDDIKVDYYGSPTALNGVASLSVPEPRMILIKPWDPSVLGLIERAISASSLGITPNNDGKVIRLVFPELTGDRRKDLVRKVQELAEHAKVGIRAVRREYNELFKAMEKDRDITEDELVKALDKIQKDTDGWCTKVDTLMKDKEAEILEV